MACLSRTTTTGHLLDTRARTGDKLQRTAREHREEDDTASPHVDRGGFVGTRSPQLIAKNK